MSSKETRSAIPRAAVAALLLHGCWSCFGQSAQVTKRSAKPKAEVAASADLQRAKAIRSGIEAIEAECDSSAHGDWNQWYRSLDGFRDEMLKMIQAGRVRGENPFLFRTSDTPPFFDDPNDLGFLWEEGSLPDWRQRRNSADVIVRVAKWFRKKNIDLIVVPVPKMTEVYADHLAQHVPPNRVVAPQCRKLILELLRADVEVIDLLPSYLAAIPKSGDPLYLFDDTHWAPPGQAIAAAAIGQRLKRYPFVREAISRPPVFFGDNVKVKFDTGCWRTFLPHPLFETIHNYDWSGVRVLNELKLPVMPVDSSPVVIIGDSFARVALTAGMCIDAQVAKQINLAVTNLAVSGPALNSIRDFAREPDLLAGRKVIVWIVTGGSFYGAVPWNLPPLPE
jgi:hypothetical protein